MSTLDEIARSACVSNDLNSPHTNFIIYENWEELKRNSPSLKDRVKEIEDSVLLQMDDADLIHAILKEEESLMWVFNAAIEDPILTKQLIRKYFSIIDRKPLLTEKVNQLFQQLAEQLGSSCEVIPINYQSYAYLDSLKKLWEKGILPKLEIAPQLETTEEIREWLLQYGPSLHIYYINLSNCGLKMIPPEIALLTNLLYLDLKNNQIEIIPACMHKLDNLYGLYLDNNQIETIPEFMYNMKSLYIFSFTNNPIKSLPEFVCKCNNCYPIETKKVTFVTKYQTCVIQ